MRFAPAAVTVESRGERGIVLRSPLPLGPHARCTSEWLERWAREAPDRTFLAEREAVTGGWRSLRYDEALASVRGIAQGLIDLGASVARPVLLLSDNAIDHALVQLAAMHVGVPAVPVSPAWSTASRDFARLRAIAEVVDPAVVFCAEPGLYAQAIAAAVSGRPLIASQAGGSKTIGELARLVPGDGVAHAAARVGPDTIAKVLFTSGSTGVPKGVVNTQRMICSNQQAIVRLWPLLTARPPVVVDWLPWSHTFGGNHNFNMVLANGGTLFIDEGKPAPGLFEKTLANLREVSPTLYFNVPRGFDRLATALEQDESLRARFFGDLDLLFYAAAALPQSTWERLDRLARLAGGGAREGNGVPFVSAWGSTETAPLVTSVHFPIARAGVIGLPAPGIDLALVPDAEGDGKLEMRVRGPNVTPGYWGKGGVVEPAPRDADGFLPTGDAGRLEDPHDPARGVVFDGRTAENFKLSTGTWVSVGELRIRVLSLCAPLAQDAVVAGHDRDHLALLLFVAIPCPVDRPTLIARIKVALQTHNLENPSSSKRVARVLLLDEPPSIDGGEITDKGYVNQRAVLTRRASLVERLYSEPAHSDVIVLG